MIINTFSSLLRLVECLSASRMALDGLVLFSDYFLS
jgi:hypothetical protein